MWKHDRLCLWKDHAYICQKIENFQVVLRHADQWIEVRQYLDIALADTQTRVVVGQHLMQAASDMFLGWTTGATGKFYYWRQFKDMKGSVEVDGSPIVRMQRYAQVCGWTLARAHARSGDSQAIAGYLGKGEAFDKAIADFAVAYADQNDSDYKEFKAAIDSGQIAAHE